MAPGARVPLVGLSLRVFISRRLVLQEESSVRGAADLASRSHLSQKKGRGSALAIISVLAHAPGVMFL